MTAVAIRETVLTILDPRVLLEMAWEDLIGFQADDEEIGENLEALYELEYKYSMLSTKPFEGVPQRRKRMLERLEAVAYPLVETLARQILEVYEEWLTGHAISNPAEWADARVRQFEETEYGEVTTGAELATGIEAAWNEYDRYVYHGGRFPPGSPMQPARPSRGPDSSEIAQAVREGKLPVLQMIAEAIMVQENEDMAGEEDFEPYDNPADYVEVFIESPGSLREFVEGLNWDYIEASPRQFLLDLYETFVFPAWWAHWKARGIERTRKRIEDGVDLLRAIEADSRQFSVQNLFGKLNELVNLTHQTGGMAEYLENRYNIDATFLQELSDRDTADWDEELRELGVRT